MDYNKIRKQEHRTRRIVTACVCAVAGAALLGGGIAAGVHMHSRNIASKNDAAEIDTVAARTQPPQQPEATIVTVPAVEEATTAPDAASPADEGSGSADSASLAQNDTSTSNASPAAATTSRRGTSVEIPQDIREYMSGKSMSDNDDISFDDLRYLTIPHYDFNYNVTEGHMVVNAAVAEDVLDIFAELYDARYPIERMELVDAYDADDYASIDNNNTSAFNYRPSTDGTGRLSKHALGRAIDINPQINPYVTSEGTGAHSNASEYWSRDYESWSSDIARAAYIGPDSKIYDIFISHGWEWGGNWSSYRDYQHFQKTS